MIGPWIGWLALVLGTVPTAVAEPLPELTREQRALVEAHARSPSEATSTDLLEAAQGATDSCAALRASRLEDDGSCVAAVRLTEAARGPDHLEMVSKWNDLAYLHYVRGQFRDAEGPYRRALAILEVAFGADHPEIVTGINNLAVLLSTMGSNGEAETLLRRALKIVEKARGEDHVEVLAPLNNLGAVLWTTGKYADAEPLFRRALVISEANYGPDDPKVATALQGLAMLFFRTGRFAEAEPRLRRVLAIREAVLEPDHPHLAVGLDNLAHLLQTVGAYAEAESLVRRALAMRERTLGSDHPDVAGGLSILAALLHSRGAYAEEERAARRALAISESAFGPNHPEVASNLQGLARALTASGALAEAERLYRRALDVAKANFGSEHPYVASALTNLAKILTDHGMHDRAEPLFREALAIRVALLGPDHPDTARTMSGLARDLRGQGRFQDALALLRRSETALAASLGTEHPETATIRSNLADLLLRTGAFDEAKSLYRQAIDIRAATTGLGHRDAVLALLGLSVLQVRQGHFQEALRTHAEAVRAAESNITRNLLGASAGWGRSFLRRFRALTDYAVWLNINHLPQSESAARLALLTLLQGKGRLVDLEQDILRRIRDRADAAEMAVLEDLRRKVAYLGVLQAQPPRGQAALDAWKERGAALASEVEALQRELAERSAPYRRANLPLTVDDVAAKLPTGHALLEFVVYSPWDAETRDWLRTRYAAYLLHADGHIDVVDLGSTAEIDVRVREFREAIRARVSTTTTARALFVKTLAPLAAELADVEGLNVAADGLLHLVPFDALVQSAGEGLETVSVHYLTSGRDLLRDPDDVPLEGPLVVYGVDYDRGLLAESPDRNSTARWQPLDGTIEEGRRAVRLLRGGRALVGAEATETALRQVRSPSLLHVASHGFFISNADPDYSLPGSRSVWLRPGVRPTAPVSTSRPAESPLLQSGLVLAGANLPPIRDDDGLLTAAELANFDLRGTKLVVLSACETGNGEIRNGDGVLGLRRAAILAGARAQVVSLWKVDDRATAALMTSFYKALKRGNTVDDALAAAKAAVRRRPEWDHPFYWAAFTVSGEANVRL